MPRRAHGAGLAVLHAPGYAQWCATLLAVLVRCSLYSTRGAALAVPRPRCLRCVALRSAWSAALVWPRRSALCAVRRAALVVRRSLRYVRAPRSSAGRLMPRSPRSPRRSYAARAASFSSALTRRRGHASRAAPTVRRPLCHACSGGLAVPRAQRPAHGAAHTAPRSPCLARWATPLRCYARMSAELCPPYFPVSGGWGHARSAAFVVLCSLFSALGAAPCSPQYPRCAEPVWPRLPCHVRHAMLAMPCSPCHARCAGSAMQHSSCRVVGLGIAVPKWLCRAPVTH